MAVSFLGRLASSAPVPVFAVVGAGARREVQGLRAHDGIELVASPRHATVLLVAGALPQDLLGEALQVHDQLPTPRGVLRWADGGTWPGPHVQAGPDDDVVAVLRELHGELVTGGRDSAPPRLPADHPVPWQGVGPHGHGGEGMMGGTPYGRPLPMPPQEGRDGLALDRLSLTLGPFLPCWPPGLRLEVGLQGDVLEEVSLGANPFATPRETWDGAPLGAPLDATSGTSAGETPADDLLRLADLLSLAGLDALARRATRLAVDGDERGVADLRRRLARSTALRWMTRGVGTTDLTGATTDAEARWQAWLAPHDAAAAHASDPSHAPHAHHVLHALPELLTGMEWGEALTTIATLPVDLETVARDTEVAA